MTKNQSERKNFLRKMVHQYLEENPDEQPQDIYERMKMERRAFYSYLREGKNSSPEIWPIFRAGLKVSRTRWYEEASYHFN